MPETELFDSITKPLKQNMIQVQITCHKIYIRICLLALNKEETMFPDNI